MPPRLTRLVWRPLRRPIALRALQQPPPRPASAVGVRYASRQSTSASAATRAKNLLLGTFVGLSAYIGYLYVTDTRAGVHQWLVVPLLRWLYPDAEEAHVVGNKTLKALHAAGLNPRERDALDSQGDLMVEIFGQTILNPIGTSAGIDKNAEIPCPLLDLGPAIIEIGGVTAQPQDGNAQPRVFRLPSQNALINRYGLNSEGAEAVAMRLRQRLREFAYASGFGLDEEGERAILDGEAGVPPGSLRSGRLLAVQIAKNKFTPDADVQAVRDDYVFGVETLGRYADIVVVNVSSPNTPGLRDMQRVGPLTTILQGVVDAAAHVDRRTRPAVMVKVSPDEDSAEQVAGICQAVVDSGVDGIIVGNTTKQRPEPAPSQPLSSSESRLLLEQGGYSGPQLFDRTVNLVKRYRTLLDRNTSPDQPPRIIFASGGIVNGRQMLEVLNAGASVGMIYTALVYGGAGTISRIKREMREEMAKAINEK